MPRIDEPMPSYRSEPRGDLSRRSDTDLIGAALDGQGAAWRELLSRYEGLIFALASRIGLSRPDAEDVFQNVSVKLYQHLSDLKSGHSLKAWLISVTRREAALLFRNKAPRLFTEEERIQGLPELLPPAFGDQSPAPDEEIIAWERQSAVRQAFSSLPDKCRRLIKLLYGSDPPPTYAEVAASLGMPVGSVGPGRARCLEQIRDLLARSGEL